MGLQLEKVVPWGRSLAEYQKMFDLKPAEFSLKILDCAGGPASFNAEMTAQGYAVISCDPIYQFSSDEIAQRIAETYPVIIQGVEKNHQDYIWKEIQSPRELGRVRMAAMEKFLVDFPVGKKEGRYLTAELPDLPFESQKFDLALCSHFLFSYSDGFSGEFHLEAIAQLCRVATEVRIFPLLTVSGEVSPHLDTVIHHFKNLGYEIEIRTVSYEFQKSGNQFLRLIHPE